MSRKGKGPDPPDDNVPLFEIDIPVVSKDKAPAVKSARQGNCPCCQALKSGLLWSGNHLVWRAHTYRTWGGTAVPCPSSGVAVCVAPERHPLVSSDPAKCRHP